MAEHDALDVLAGEPGAESGVGSRWFENRSAVTEQHVGPRQVLESIFGKAPASTTLASAIEQVAVAWERMQDGSQ